MPKIILVHYKPDSYSSPFNLKDYSLKLKTFNHQIIVLSHWLFSRSIKSILVRSSLWGTSHYQAKLQDKQMFEKNNILTLNRKDNKIEAQNTTLAISTERMKNLSLFTRSQINSQLLNLCNEIDAWKLVCQVLASTGLNVFHKGWFLFFLKGNIYIEKQIIQRSCEHKHKTRDTQETESIKTKPKEYR